MRRLYPLPASSGAEFSATPRRNSLVSTASLVWHWLEVGIRSRPVQAPCASVSASSLWQFQVASAVQTLLQQVSPHGGIRLGKFDIELCLAQTPRFAGVGV